MKEQISIKVQIADRAFPLKVNADEEENIRKAAAEGNQKIKLYTEQYMIKDKQAALSMVALDLATEVLNSKFSLDENKAAFEQKLVELNALLDD